MLRSDDEQLKVSYLQGRPIGRGNGATALGPWEVGAPTHVVVYYTVRPKPTT